MKKCFLNNLQFLISTREKVLNNFKSRFFPIKNFDKVPTCEATRDPATEPIKPPLSPTNFQIYKKWSSPVFCFSKSMVYWGYKINKTKTFFCQIFILWILEVSDVTEVKKDPKTHEN